MSTEIVPLHYPLAYIDLTHSLFPPIPLSPPDTTHAFLRVPKELKGPLDTHWKARDAEGYIINYDGTRSACVHQWDR